MNSVRGHFSSAGEPERAFERFDASITVHNAAIAAMKFLAAGPEVRDALATNLRISKGMQSTIGAEQADRYGAVTLETLAEERNREFLVIIAL